jgi:hypothetical protein
MENVDVVFQLTRLLAYSNNSFFTRVVNSLPHIHAQKGHYAFVQFAPS